MRTGLVMFEWHAMGHVPLSASHWPVPTSAATPWDWFHINTVDVEPDQNLLINSRNTWAAYQVGHTYGEILWSLGGRSSSFALGPGVRFAWQHDATMLPDGTIQIFDNEDDPEIEPSSRGIDIRLDFATHTATLAHQYLNPGKPVLADSQGDVQQLPDGGHLIGWGAVGLVTELSPSGSLALAMTLAPGVASYRAYRFPWVATPATAPAIAASVASGAATTQIAASWNGATGVVSWQVLAGPSPRARARRRPRAEHRLPDHDRRADHRALRGGAGARRERHRARRLSSRRLRLAARMGVGARPSRGGGAAATRRPGGAAVRTPSPVRKLEA